MPIRGEGRGGLREGVNSNQKSRMPQKKPTKVVKRSGILSPFRYPGGKSWLRPIMRKWLTPPVAHLVEPFAGGANITLSALAENLAARATMIEIDPDVAAVWAVILNGNSGWLADKIQSFRVNRVSVNNELEKTPKSEKGRAWTTLLRNRVSHGGIIAPGAGMINRGENDKGLKSRWYAKTIQKRIKAINAMKDRIDFLQADALAWMSQFATCPPVETTAYFIDPPYAVAGKRLYTHNELNHRRLFEIASRLGGRVLMTYEDTDEVRALADEFEFAVHPIQMRSRLNRDKTELLIATEFSWLTH